MGGTKWKYDKGTYEFIWEEIMYLRIRAISDDENGLVKEDFWGEINWSSSWNRKPQGNFNCRGF